MKLHPKDKPPIDTTPTLNPVAHAIRELIQIVDLIVRADSRPSYFMDAARMRVDNLKKLL